MDGSSTKPFIQMLPLTNKAAARKDFVSVRLGGVDTIASQTLLPADQGKESPLQPGEARQHLEEKVISRWPYILAGCLVAVFLIIGLIVWKCCCQRRAKKQQPLGKKPLSLADNLKNGKDLKSRLSGPTVPRLSQLPKTYMHLDDRTGSKASVAQSSTSPTVAQAYDPQQNVEFLQQTYGHPGPRQPPANAIYEPSYEHSQPDHYDDHNHHQQGSGHSFEQAPYQQRYDHTQAGQYSSPYETQYDQQYSHPQAAQYSEPSYGWNQGAAAIQHPPSAADTTNYAGRGTRATPGQNRAGFGAAGYR